MKASKAYWTNGYTKTPIEDGISSKLVEKLLSDVRKKVAEKRGRKFTDNADTYHIWLAGDGWEILFSSEDE